MLRTPSSFYPMEWERLPLSDITNKTLTKTIYAKSSNAKRQLKTQRTETLLREHFHSSVKKSPIRSPLRREFEPSRLVKRRSSLTFRQTSDCSLLPACRVAEITGGMKRLGVSGTGLAALLECNSEDFYILRGPNGSEMEQRLQLIKKILPTHQEYQQVRAQRKGSCSDVEQFILRTGRVTDRFERVSVLLDIGACQQHMRSLFELTAYWRRGIALIMGSTKLPSLMEAITLIGSRLNYGSFQSEECLLTF